MPVRHAFEWLPENESSGGEQELPDVVVVSGGDATLRSWVIGGLSREGDRTQFDGEVVRWNDLRDDLQTASLFDMGEKRTIVVRDADKFLSAHRGELEAYVARPSSANRFVLELGSLASNTRIYKAVVKDHLLVACSSSPDKKLGVTAAGRRKFLTGYIARRHGCKLAAGAADRLIEMLGEEIGMLETEIAKLAVYQNPGDTIDEALVEKIVAGWQGQTIWQITDAIAAGDAAEALRQLDKLISGGQRPIALLPQIAWWLRRLGMATSVVLHREKEGRVWRLEDAIAAAGIHRPGDIQRAKKQLKSLGRERANRLLPWLLDADLRLKGTHSQEGRDRMLLEQFVLRLAKI
ncbi:DNA polymerase III subunit delta [Crateriforma conspicua]|uniref:DNA-directed DNA polymerase n=1 Tax=Crateriforma conspicua TaxID=2527996 RepID=A0A5C6FUP2_9PLAN|nr:DNA polymerase III subunit delta [Crateriforma conspicua]TWU65220.1 DNA polymerase III subunit delta [Crateriforma conspicua]